MSNVPILFNYCSFNCWLYFEMLFFDAFPCQMLLIKVLHFCLERRVVAEQIEYKVQSVKYTHDVCLEFRTVNLVTLYSRENSLCVGVGIQEAKVM